MKIKAISLYQPWASLIAVGAKRYETRSWATSYRGPLLICAALKEVVEKNYLAYDRDFRDAVYDALHKDSDGLVPWMVPHGRAVAIVDLYECFHIGQLLWKGAEKERFFGDFSFGRYAWKLENVRAIDPFPVKGRQGLFEVEILEGLL